MHQKLTSILAVAMLGTLPVFAQTGGASTPAVGSVWTYDNSYQMTVEATTPEYRARYTQKKGSMTGQIQGDQVEGFWMQESSKQKCSTQKNGSSYWGGFRITFTQGGYSGKWGYCNEPLTRDMTGKRVR